MFTICRHDDLLLHRVSKHGFLTHLNSPAPQCLRPNYLLSYFPPHTNAHPRKYSWQDFRTELVDSRLVFRRTRMIFHHRNKRNYWSFEWFSKLPVINVFLSARRVLNISQIATAFHRIGQPFFIQARTHQCSTGSFFNSAYRFLSNTVRLGTMVC